MGEAYFLGGSPCCGKSTIAEMLVEKHGFQYYKLDDHLDEYLQKGANDGYDLYKKITSLTLDEIWLRSPLEQSDEEIAIYEIMFTYTMNAINSLADKNTVIAEGAGFLPHMIKKQNIDRRHYACIVPTKDFQVKHYSERQWIKNYLSACTNQDKAFYNWMERDTIFAKTVLEDAKNWDYFTMVVDGKQNVDENYKEIEALFGLCTV